LLDEIGHGRLTFVERDGCRRVAPGFDNGDECLPLIQTHIGSLIHIKIR
jgi:hypothetical protein